MNIQQIADVIDKNNWGFSVFQTKPTYKKLVSNAHKDAPSNAGWRGPLVTREPDALCEGRAIGGELGPPSVVRYGRYVNDSPSSAGVIVGTSLW